MVYFGRLTAKRTTPLPSNLRLGSSIKRPAVSDKEAQELMMSRAYAKAAENQAYNNAAKARQQAAQSGQTAQNGQSLTNNMNTLMQGINSIGGMMSSKKASGAEAPAAKQQVSNGTPVNNAEAPSGTTDIQAPASTSVDVPNSVQDMYSDPATYKTRVIDGQIVPMEQQVNSNLAEAKSTFDILQAQKQDAQTTVSTLEGQIQKAQQESESAKTTLDNDKKQYEKSVKDRDQLDKDLAAVNNEYKTACDNVTTKEGEKSQAQTVVSDCKTAVTTAETNLRADTAEFNAAENALRATPQTLPNGLPNPQYEIALNAKNAAQIKKEQSEATLKKCQESLKEAEGKLAQKEQELEKAQTEKTQLLDKLSSEESKYKQVAKNCKQLENQVQNNQGKYDNSLKEYDNAKNNYDKLNTELESARGIITQAEQYENRIATLQDQAAKVADLKGRAMETLAQKKGASTQD